MTIEIEIQMFGMIMLPNGEGSLAANYDDKEPEFWDVVAFEYDDEEGIRDPIEEIEDITDHEEALRIANDMCVRHGVDGFEEL